MSRKGIEAAVSLRRCHTLSLQVSFRYCCRRLPANVTVQINVDRQHHALLGGASIYWRGGAYLRIYSKEVDQ